MLTSLLMNPLMITTLASCIFVYLLFHVFVRRFATRNSSCFSPPTYPIIGCLVSFYLNRYRLLNWYTDLLAVSPTQTITISRYGARRTIVTANPANVEYILKTNFNNFPKGKAFTEILGDFLGNGIFNVDGELWHSQRKLASHQFTAKSLQGYVVNVLHEEIDNKLLPMLDSMATDATKNAVDLQDLLRKVGFNVVCKFTLGFDIGAACCWDQYCSPLMEAFDLASEICARRGAAPVSAVWKFKRFLGVGSERKLREAIDGIRSSVMSIIREKKTRLLSSSKLGSHHQGQDEGIIVGEDLLSKIILFAGDKEELTRDMVISFIMAGKDTTSAAMTWLFYMLSCHPAIEDKVVKELGFLDNNIQRLSSNESLRQMRWLKACLCECLRLYPPVAWDSKHAVADDVLPDGTPIHAGDRVTYFPYGMGRMESLWGKDRFEFKPERWFLKSAGDEEVISTGRRRALKRVSAYKFPVFQAGPRVCLGKELAFIQMKYVMASILKRFEIRPVSSDPPKFVPLLTAHMAGGFKVFVHRRKLI